MAKYEFDDDGLNRALAYLDESGYKVDVREDKEYVCVKGKKRGGASIWPEHMEFDVGGQITEKLDNMSRSVIRHILGRAGLEEVDAYA